MKTDASRRPNLPRAMLLALAACLLLIPSFVARSSEQEPSSSHKVSLIGRLLDPPAGTSVTIERVGKENGGDRRVGEIDSAGYFSFSGLQPALWRVEIDAGGGNLLQDIVPLFSSLVLPPVHPGESGAPPPLRARNALTEEIILSRRVLGIEREHVAPVEGAWIWTEDREADAVRTSSDGTYRLQAPRARRIRIHFAAPGYLPVTVAVSTDHEDVEQRGPLITLYSSVQLTGCVRDVEGRPLPDAWVEIDVDEDDGPRTGAGPLIGFTDSVGCFYQQARMAPRYQITGMAPGFLPKMAVLDLPTDKRRVEVDFILPASRTVSGHVVDQSGVPIEGAQVTFVRGSRQSARLSALAGRFSKTDRHPKSTTSAGGAFEIHDVSPGTYTITVIAAGFEPAVVSGVELEQSSLPWSLGTIFLASAAVFEGRVEDPSGTPVAGAEVWVSLVSPDGRSRAARPMPADRTDDDGYFAIEDLGRDQLVEVRVEKKGFVPAVLTSTPSRAGDDIIITLEPGLSIEGKVLDERLAPVSNAAVKILTIDGKPQTLRSIGVRGAATGQTRTGEDGSFRLFPLEAGAYELSFESPCCVQEIRRLEVPDGHIVKDYEVILFYGVALGGVVTDFQGTVIEGAVVTAAGRSDTTRKDGRFRLEGLPEEPTAVKVRHYDFGATMRHVDPRLNREISVVFRDPGVIAGRVVDRNGGVLSGARVYADVETGAAPFQSTDSSGQFRLKVQPGTYKLRAGMEGYSSSGEKSVTLQSSETVDVELTLDRGARVRGRILGAASTEMGQAYVRAVASSGKSIPGTTDYEGRYSLSGLEPGLWRVIVDLPNGRRGEAAIELREGERTAVLDLDVTEGYSLEGRILLDREPLANGWVTISSLDGVPIARVVASLDGRFDLTGLAGGPIQIRVATPEGDMQVTRTVDTRHEAQVEIEIETGRLFGSIRCADTGVAVPDARIHVIALDQTRRDVRVGEDGSFGPLRLAQGTYRLEVSSAQYRPAVIVTVITPDRDNEVAVLLSPLPH